MQKNKKSKDMRTENNDNITQEDEEPLKEELQEKLALFNQFVLGLNYCLFRKMFIRKQWNRVIL